MISTFEVFVVVRFNVRDRSVLGQGNGADVAGDDRTTRLVAGVSLDGGGITAVVGGECAGGGRLPVIAGGGAEVER